MNKSFLQKIKEIDNGVKLSLGIFFVLAALFLIGIADLDYGYYTFLRVFTLISLSTAMLCYYFEAEYFLQPVSIVCSIIIILFNPILPIYLDKDVWVVLDIISAVCMVFLFIYVFAKAITNHK